MVRITYLEMTSPQQLVQRGPKKNDLDIRECLVKQHQLSRFLYFFVGEDWLWREHRPWSDEQWRQYTYRDNMRTFVAYHGGSIAGFYELEREENGDVQILFFGLTPQFIGQGYGRYMLTRAIEDAWAWDARRVWVHTCTNDHPHALGNYLKAGFKVYKIEDRPD